MSRFFKNRLWTFILALSLCIGGTAVLTGTAVYASDAPAISDDPFGGGTGTGYGDPDAPSGDSKRAALRGGARVPMRSATIAGDDVGLQSAWMWRLRFALQSLRGIWIHP
jgi:hypothetical protein